MNNKKIAVPMICLVMILSSIVIVIEIAPRITGAMIYVDDDYGSEDATHKKTIQAGVDAAQPGDTVYVYNGTYYENVIVGKTITLNGEARDNTIIVSIDEYDDVVTITANWVNITGFTVSYGRYGISVRSASHNTIINNTATNNQHGIFLYHSNNTFIANNTASSNNYDGIVLGGSNNNTIANNTLSNNDYGIYVRFSNRNIFTDNVMVNNGIFIYGDMIEHWNTHTIDTTNSINGKPVYYWKNQIGGTVPLGAGEVILANCNGVRIENQNVSHGSIGIEVGFSVRNTIANNTASSNKESGIFLYDSTNNIIYNNTATSNIYYGIVFSSSNNNSITNNTVLDNWYGLSFYNSNNSKIINNTASLNKDYGIILGESINNSIVNNTFSNNHYGLFLWGSNNNQIYHNNIINNTHQAFDDRNDNYWDNGYPSGGNYWSDYVGVDNFKGTNQDIPGSDGIGDTNYSIDFDSIDNYPLMSPIGNDIFLYEGWNLISIPFILSDTNLGVVFNSIKGSYDAVQWYNISDTSDHWKHNSTKKPFHLNDLDSIDHTMGFWIHITEPGGVLFQYPGTKPMENQTINIHPGWNLIGYPSIASHNRTQGLNNITFGTDVDSIWTYNAATKKWEEITASDNFEVGKGYWIHAKNNVTWIVPL